MPTSKTISNGDETWKKMYRDHFRIIVIALDFANTEELHPWTKFSSVFQHNFLKHTDINLIPVSDTGYLLYWKQYPNDKGGSTELKI